LKVDIITEGYTGTGYGHLTRCLSLYQAFKENGIEPVFTANCDEAGKKYLGNINLQVYNWLEHEYRLIEQLKNTDIAIIDSYIAQKEFYKLVSDTVKKAVYIDDFIRIEYPKGIVINGSIGAENLPYKKNDDLVYFLGLDYMPLRKEYWNLKVKPQTKAVKNVLVTFGGQDNRNLTFLVLDLLINKYSFLKYHVVLANKNILKNQINNDRLSVKYYSELNAKQMIDLMMKCDIAVSAAGQTTYELAVVGIPTVAIGVAENQKFNIKGWINAGFLNKEIWRNDDNLLSIINAEFENILNNYKPKQFHKANGAVNIVKKLLTEETKKNILLRKFSEKDIKTIYELSNDSEVRNVSINTNDILWEEHTIWFNKTLTDKDAYNLIAETNDAKFIGQIKFNIEKEIALISISIHNYFRGKGYATNVLKLSCEDFFNSFTKIDTIGAYILKDNFRSIKSFTNAGFVYNSEKLIDKGIFNFYLLNRNQIK